jgi:hypothetical protein
LFQAFIGLAVISFGIFLVFLSRRTAVFVAIYFFGFISAALINTIWTSFPETLALPLRYELLYCLKQAVEVQNLATQDIIRMVLVGISYVLLFAALGIVIFQKSDLK